jgi:hypothetical protein
MAKKFVPQHTPEVRDKDKILVIAEDYGLTKKIFLDECKANNVGGVFDVKNWDRYMQVIRNYRILHPIPKPKQLCPICGEEMHVDPNLIGRFRSSPMTGMRCNDRHHFFMLLEAARIQEENKCTFEESVIIVCFLESKRTLVVQEVPYNLYAGGMNG